MHAHAPELRECVACGAEYDLARQSYYGPKCPSCTADEDPERTWPGCCVCSERIPPGERASKVMGGSFGVPAERVPVHERCK